MTLERIEGRIANALVSRAVEASELRVRVIALEQLVRMIGAATKEPDVLKLVALADREVANRTCDECGGDVGGFHFFGCSKKVNHG